MNAFQIYLLGMGITFLIDLYEDYAQYKRDLQIYYEKDTCRERLDDNVVKSLFIGLLSWVYIVIWILDVIVNRFTKVISRIIVYLAERK